MPPWRILWLADAQADIRRLDRALVMRIFDGVLHFAKTGSGDVSPLRGDLEGDSMRIARVHHRSEAYRSDYMPIRTPETQ